MGEFLSDLKKEFGRGDNETMKMAELKNIKQESKIIEKFVQKFRKVAKESRYEEYSLIEQFKGGMNRMIRRKLIEAKRPPRSH